MSSQQLHDLLAELVHARQNVDLVDSEHQQRLDEIVESLEQQKIYPEAFDQYSNLSLQIRTLVLEFESDHPAMARILNSIQQVLSNFKS